MRSTAFHWRIVLLVAVASVLWVASLARAADTEKFPLKLNLKKGDSHEVTLRYEVDVAGADGKMRPLRNLDSDMKLTVLDIDDEGRYLIEVRFERLKYSEMKVDYDSQAAKGSPRNNSQIANALFDHPLVYILTPKGELSPAARGQDELLKAVNAAINIETGGDMIFGMVTVSMKRFMWDVAFVKSPPSRVAIGDSWTFTPPAQKHADNSFKSLKYTLGSHDKGRVRLDVEGTASDRPRNGKEAEVTIPFQVELDDQTGWPVRVKSEYENKSPPALFKVLIETKN